MISSRLDDAVDANNMPKFSARGLLAVVNIIAALLVTTGVIAGAKRSHSVKASWQESLDYMEAAEARLKALDHTRQPLWGDSLEGRAFDSYDVALTNYDFLVQLPDAVASCEIVRLFLDDATRDEAKETMWTGGFYQPHALAILAAIRQGAHQVDAAPPAVTRSTESMPMYMGSSLVSLVHAHAAKLEADGQSVEAARMCLDLAQMGADQMNVPVFFTQMGGHELCATSFLGAEGEVDDEARLLYSMSAAGRRECLNALPSLIDRFDRSSHAMDGEFIRHALTAKATNDRQSVHATAYWMHFAYEVQTTKELREGFTHICATTPEEADSYTPTVSSWLQDADLEPWGNEAMFKSLMNLERSRISQRDALIAVRIALTLDLEGSAEAVQAGEHDHIQTAIFDNTIEVSWYCLDTRSTRTLRIARSQTN